MTRYLILILLALVVTACGGSKAPIPDPVATQVVVEQTAEATRTAKALTATPRSTDTSIPTPTATPAKTATQSTPPSHSYTSTSTLGSATSTPGSTPTPAVETRTRSRDSMTMVYVPPGEFTMGNLLGVGSDEEAPQHQVTLDGFWIDRTEVTNAQYRLFVEATGHQAPISCDWGEPTYGDGAKTNHPVVCVTWYEAIAYCEWAGARLPTEAEWEKAARGTDQRIFPWGNSFDGSRFNYCDTSCEFSQRDTRADDGYAQTAPVGSYPAGASPYGALDMAGNVWEMVSDWYAFDYYSRSPQLNPQGPHSSQYRVLRGGSWFGLFENGRSAFRGWLAPEKQDVVVGFRCVVPDVVPGGRRCDPGLGRRPGWNESRR